MVLITFSLSILLTFGCALFAILRGDAALRAGGILIVLLNAFTPTAAFIASTLHSNLYASNIVSDFVTTLAISFGFLYLGYRHGSIWLAPAMTMQGAELYILSQELSESIPPLTLVIWDNLITCAVAIALAIGVLASARERRTQSQATVFRAHGSTTEPADEGIATIPAEGQESVFVFHLPKDDSNTLVSLAAEAKVLPSQYIRELIATFLDGDHYAPQEREDAFAPH